MAKRRRKPKIGDTIIHTEPEFDRETIGKVEQILSQQFVYRTESGSTKLCMFYEDWRKK